jgi:hypothetical protein
MEHDHLLACPFYVDTARWVNYDSVKEWWESVIYTNGTRRKSLAPPIMFTSWEILNKRNARVFCNISTMPTVVMEKIKVEASFWSVAGSKALRFDNDSRVVLSFELFLEHLLDNWLLL